MHSHNGYWRRLHLDDDFAQRTVSTLVFANSRFWITAFVFNAQSASVIASWLSVAHVERIIEHHSAATSARTRAYKLCWQLTRAVLLSAGAFAEMFDN